MKMLVISLGIIALTSCTPPRGGGLHPDAKAMLENYEKAAAASPDDVDIKEEIMLIVVDRCLGRLGTDDVKDRAGVAMVLEPLFKKHIGRNLGTSAWRNVIYQKAVAGCRRYTPRMDNLNYVWFLSNLIDPCARLLDVRLSPEDLLKAAIVEASFWRGLFGRAFVTGLDSNLIEQHLDSCRKAGEKLRKAGQGV